jgi:serine/threonine protein kinase
LASEKQSGYKVALKVQKTDDNVFCEIDIHDKLDHPNIVRMIDYFYSFKPFASEEEEQGWEGGPLLPQNREHLYLYMILEVCEGGSLHDKIDNAPNGRIPEQQAAKYFLDAVQALEYLHEQGMIHCDCKPANFLLGLDGCVKLADFGMAVHDEEKEVVGGSPVYMAPEHLMAWRQMTDDFDYRSDIYSLGVVLYEMLEGVLPYIVREAPNMHTESCGPDSIYDSDDEELFPVLDLRKLHDMSSEEPFYVPPPLFLAEISEDAEDLVTRLMDPSASERISLAEAKDHPWLKKINL